MKLPRVLLVDDEEVICRMVGSALRGHAEIWTTTSSDEALAWIADGEVFDAILCDYHMPSATGGTFYRRLIETSPPHGERVAFVTGSVTPEQLQTFGRPVLSKPFDLRRLFDLVDRLASGS